MSNFGQINRLMGTLQERIHQMENGDFNDRLERLMNRADPHWEEREETEMDIYERQAPVGVKVNDQGEVLDRATQTARTPTEAEEHDVDSNIVATELIPKDERSLEKIPE